MRRTEVPYRDWRKRHQEEVLAQLSELIAIPSISADPAFAKDVQRCAQALVQQLRGLGFDAQALQTGGNPVAYGEWNGAAGKPTAIVYGHYDVQPVDPLELWESPPFEARVRDGKIYGRGAVDDKGQVVMHLAAIQAHFELNGALPINLKIVIEGEEEIGSPNFERFLESNRERLSADLVIISDTGVYSEDVPSLTTSLRGLISWEIAVHGPSSDLHSGLYGGVVRNPIEALCAMLATLKDSDGRVRVPGFYDDVRELEESERNELRGLPFDEQREAKLLGVPAFVGERERLPVERMWFRPTMEINGIWGGYQGAGSKTIIPSWARAKLTARLVAEQDPIKIGAAVRSFLERGAPFGVRVDVQVGDGVRPVSTSRSDPVVGAAARAMRQGFGKEPVFIGSGGSIGPVAMFDRLLAVPQILLGVGLPDDAIHAPNEKFTLNQFFRGIDTVAYLYDELAALPR